MRVVYQKPVAIRHNGLTAESKGLMWKRISQLIEQFLDALWLEKNLAENTLSAYRRDLTMLVEWLAHRGLSLASAQA
ncbi:site-specific tyrosine recombinase XerD [Enterobacter asburiae]|uniref:Site-specific tyrosine recombinase XerD n=1 Tax=Enterobacter asburiae TaxID=61645 RepID=A0A376FCH5_ENTAS|nr:site-specific tyrosine recombinase XerD [Enterobacter asburiae]